MVTANPVHKSLLGSLLQQMVRSIDGFMGVSPSEKSAMSVVIHGRLSREVTSQACVPAGVAGRTP